MKTHFICSERLPLLRHTAAALYVVRHPIDVLWSNFHYARRSGVEPGEARAQVDGYVDEFIAHGGDPRWLQLGMGDWATHVRSWLEASLPFPVWQVRYEDLLADPHAAARSLCEFLGLERDAGQVARAVEGASFASMRRMEEADVDAGRVGIFYKPYLRDSIAAGLRFMRQGQTGAANPALSPDQYSRLERVLGAPMRQFDYTVPERSYP
jgi:hypothetical protein